MGLRTVMADILARLSPDELATLKALAVPNARGPVPDAIKAKLVNAGLIRNVSGRAQVTNQGRLRLANERAASAAAGAGPPAT